MREQQQRLGAVCPSLAAVADDNVVLVRLDAAEKDVLIGEACVPETFGNRVGDLGGPPADVDAVVLDDLLVHIARVLLRGRERLGVQRAGRDGEEDKSDDGFHLGSPDASLTRSGAPHLEP